MRVSQDKINQIYGDRWNDLANVFESFRQEDAVAMQKLIRFCITTEKIPKAPKKKATSQAKTENAKEPKIIDEVVEETAGEVAEEPVEVPVEESTEATYEVIEEPAEELMWATGGSTIEPTKEYLDEQIQDFEVPTEMPPPEPDRQAYLHLLILWRARAQETLPTADQLIYETIHIYRKFDLLPGYKNPSLSEQAAIASVVEEKIARALVEGDTAPFLDRSWWGRFGLAYANNPILNEKREIGKAFCSELIEFKYTGEQVGGHSQHLPPKPFVRNFCKYASLILTNPQLRSRMLYQFPNKLERVSAECGFPPVHIGWVKTGEFYNFSGVTRFWEEPSDYGTALMTQPKREVDLNLGYLLETIPNDVLFPLLSIVLFSVIKVYIKKYPSRIDLKKESYLSVLKKQEKVVFYTIHGEQAKELAHAFAGFFADYGDGVDDTDKKYLLRQARVHDGVVILDERLDNLASFQRTPMLRDACILCTNAIFEKSRNKIAIFSDTNCSVEQFKRIARIAQSLTRKFIVWFEETYCFDFSKFLEQCVKEMFEMYGRQYRDTAKFLGFSISTTNRRLKDIEENENIFKGLTGWPEVLGVKKTLELVYFDLLDAADGVYPSRIELSKKRWEKRFNPTLNEIISKWKAQERESLEGKRKERDTAIQCTQTDVDFKDWRYTNLYTAISMFVVCLERNGLSSDIALRLKSRAKEALINLSKQNELEVQPVSVMEAYLSQIIANGQVIPFRTKIYKDTLGWYDRYKNRIYLPYRRFFETVRTHWNEANKSSPVRHTKAEFLTALAESEVLIAKKNGKNSSYIRPETPVVVSPVEAKESKSEMVIKLDVSALHLSEEAQKELKRLSEIEVPRRKNSRKKASGQGRASAE